jgi:hypothetical protein
LAVFDLIEEQLKIHTAQDVWAYAVIPHTLNRSSIIPHGIQYRIDIKRNGLKK